jgi:rhamnulose-1-phosphate aldolase/alcohol dehydrogenase
MSATAELIAFAADRWGPDGIAADALAQLVRASNLLGADRAVSNFGGGNTSAKGTAVDHTGVERLVMWVKGSGSDLATIGPAGFTVLRLQEVLPLIAREEMSDEQMVAHLVRCQLDPAMPRPSIETLLHAFVPAPHVHHTHPDGINILAGSEHGEQLVRECFGGSAAWIPYIRPGFTLSKHVGEAVRDTPGLRLIVLAKHGLVVWGETAEEAYHATIDAINTAVAFVNERTKGALRFDGPAGAELDDATRHAMLMQLLPEIRGATSSERSKLLCVDESPKALEFVCSRAAPQLVEVGAPCPDHLVHTKRVPLWVPFDPASEGVEALADRMRTAAEDYRDAYREYVGEFGPDLPPMDPDARVVLVQHLGLVGVGPTLAAASLSRDLYHRAMEVMAGAQAVDRFVSLTPGESFAVEYWPLELYKLSLAPPPGELQGKVALVTGAAGGIGRAIVDALGALGASVIGFDLDGDGAEAAIARLGPRGLAVQGDVTSETDVAEAFRATTERFGGVDIVVSNAGVASSASIEDTTLADWNRSHAILATGYFLVAREAFRLLRRQGSGGSVVFVASKNGLVAGRNAAAYSSAKAAELHLARCLAEEGGGAGIRVNTVNPDAVLQGSGIWDSSWRQERAANYGIPPEDLEEHYRNRTTLRVNILPEDVAAAVVHFASDGRSGKSTGNILNVDGGVPAAYTR